MPLPKPTRWSNPSLPQMLQFAMFLLYLNGAMAVLGRLGILGGPTPYYLLGLRVFGYEVTERGLSSGPAVLMEVLAIAAYIYAGALVASERKLGWQIGAVVASGAVLIPPLILGFGLFTTDYVITWLFDLALVGLLLHEQSRNHAKTWFT